MFVDDGRQDSVCLLTSTLILLAPAEVGEVCAFLASDKSSYVTGSLIEITGKLPFVQSYSSDKLCALKKVCGVIVSKCLSIYTPCRRVVEITQESKIFS